MPNHIFSIKRQTPLVVQRKDGWPPRMRFDNHPSEVKPPIHLLVTFVTLAISSSNILPPEVALWENRKAHISSIFEHTGFTFPHPLPFSKGLQLSFKGGSWQLNYLLLWMPYKTNIPPSALEEVHNGKTVRSSLMRRLLPPSEPYFGGQIYKTWKLP